MAQETTGITHQIVNKLILRQWLPDTAAVYVARGLRYGSTHNAQWPQFLKGSFRYTSFSP